MTKLFGKYILLQIASLEEKPGVRKVMVDLEHKVYEWQVKVYNTHLRLIQEQEALIKTQMKPLQLECKGMCLS